MRGVAAFPASGGNVQEACYWEYQFMKDERVRARLADRQRSSKKAEALTHDDLEWILEQEGYETAVLRRSNAAFDGIWQIRAGHYITLAELFNFGKECCSCYDLYRACMSLPIWIHTHQHSVSQSPGVPQAKRLEAEQ